VEPIAGAVVADALARRDPRRGPGSPGTGGFRCDCPHANRVVTPRKSRVEMATNLRCPKTFVRFLLPVLPRNLVAIAATIGALSITAPCIAALTPAESTLLAVMNEARAAHNLPPLRVDAALQRAARAHSKDMLLRGYFDHGKFTVRLQRYGVRARAVGENLAWTAGYQWARRIVRMWLGSPHHRQNLLRPVFRRVGIATLRGHFGGSKVRMVTADFAG
jgi:cysteine-rich secretory family protein